MLVTSGLVVDGKVVVEGSALRDGDVVTVLAREPDEAWELSPEQERFLLESAEQARRNEVISGDELLARIAPR